MQLLAWGVDMAPAKFLLAFCCTWLSNYKPKGNKTIKTDKLVLIGRTNISESYSL